MADVKNAVAETTLLTGGAGVGEIVTLNGRVNGHNPMFSEVYPGPVTDIPVSIQAGNDWQTCRCAFNGTNQLTVQSIQAQWKGGVYDDTSPTGITLTGTPIAQITFNATSFLDAWGATFRKFAAHAGSTIHATQDPTLALKDGNDHHITAPTVGTIKIDTAGLSAGEVIHGTIEVDDSTTITGFDLPGGEGIPFWVGNTTPSWSGAAVIGYVCVVGSRITLEAGLDVGDGTVTIDWSDAASAINVSDGGSSWNNVTSILVAAGEANITPDANATSQSARAYDFSAAFSGVPDAAQVVGIEVKVTKRRTHGTADDNSIRLWDGTQVVGDNKQTDDQWPLDNLADTFYGGLSDDWNAGLTGADIKAVGFGVQVKANKEASVSHVMIGHIQMRVRYVE